MKARRCSKTKYIVIFFLFAIIALLAIGSSAWNIHLRVEQTPGKDSSFEIVNNWTENQERHDYLNQYVDFGVTESKSVTFKGKEYPTYTYGGYTYLPSPIISSSIKDESFGSIPAREFSQEILDSFVYNYTRIAKPIAHSTDRENGEWEDCNENLETAPFDAGIYQCTISNNDATYGSLIGTTTVTYVIQPKIATLYIQEAGSDYGDPLAEITAQDPNGDLCIGDQGQATSMGNFSIGEQASSPDTLLYAGTYDITGTDNAPNYYIEYVKNTYTVTPRPITVTPADKTSVYGDEVVALSADVTVGNLVGEDSLSDLVSLFTEASITSSARDYEIVGRLVESLISANYDITLNSGTYTITKAPLTITAENKNVTYGDEAPTYTTAYQGFKNGETESVLSALPSYQCDYVKGKAHGSVGDYVISNSLEEQENYYVIPVDGILSVAKKNLSFSLENKTTTYGEEAPTYTYLSSGFIDGENESTYGFSASGRFNGLYHLGDSVGDYGIVWVSDQSDFENALTNYNVALNPGSLTVEKRKLSVDIEDKSTVYGDAYAEFTAIITQGSVYGSDVAYSLNSPNLDAMVGNFAILGKIENDNYDVTFTDGTYTITQREVTLTWSNLSFIYDGEEKVPTATAGNLVFDDVVTVTVGGKQTSAGEHTATATALDNNNYCLPTAVTKAFNIAKAPLTVKIEDRESVYGEEIKTLAGSITAGTVYKEDQPYTLKTDVVKGSAVGDYEIYGEITNANYDVTFTKGNYKITKRKITVTISNASSTYGSAISPLSASITAGETYQSEVAYKVSTTATSASNAGTYPITGEITNTNYDITFIDGVYTINKAPITFTASDLSIIYGDEAPEYTYTPTAPEGVTLTASSNYTQSRDGGAVGSYVISLSATDTTGNYDITTVNGTLTVGKATLTVRATSAEITYGDPAPSYTATVSGAKYGDTFSATASCDYVQGNAVGTFDITPSLTANNNYTQALTKGTLTVKPKEVTITWMGENNSTTDFSWVYDGNKHCPTATIEGLITGDLVTITVSGGQTNAGNHTATATIEGEDVANYTIPQNGKTKDYEITRCPIAKPTAKGDVNFVYNGASQYTTILNTGFNGYDSTKMTSTPIVTTDAGNHNFTFTPTANFMWDDGTTDGAIVQITISKVKVRVISNLVEYKYTDYTSGVPLSALTTNLMTTTTCSATLCTSAKYDNGVSVANLSSTAKITVGNTYKITFNLASAKNMEFAGNNYCYLKYKTAIVGSDYFTIEDAITQNTGNVTIVGGSSFTTSFTALDYYGTKDFTIASGRNLFVPHQSGITYDGTDTNNKVYTISENATGHSTAVYSALIIPSGVNLIVNGALGIGGHIVASGNVREHGVIMNDGSITVNSKLHSYGYLKSSTGNGLVTLNSGATAKEVFRIYDYKGGRNTYGISNIFPFNAYSLHNISCKTIIHTGATYSLKFYEVISASVLGTREVIKDVVLIGSGGIFTLSDGYVIKSAENAKAKSGDTNLTTIAGSNQVAGQRDKIIVCGTVSDNSITIEESFMGMGIKITTGPNYPLPLSYFELQVGYKNGTETINGTVNLNNVSYVLLPGSSITINSGSTLNINSGISVYTYTWAQAYTDFTKPKYVYTHEGTEKADTANYGFHNYCVDKVDAYIQVDGTLNVAGNIAGKITTTQSDATLSISGSSSATITTLATLAYSSSNTKSSATYTTSTLNAFGNIDGTANSNFEVKSYVSVASGSSAYWTAAEGFSSYTLNLHTYGSTVNSATYYYQGTAPTLTPSDLGTPLRDFYHFDGWFTDQACSTAFTSQTVSDGAVIDVYAKWSPITYTVTYNLYSDKLGGTLHSESMNNSGSSASYTAESALVLKAPSATGSNGAMVFDGWYLYNPLDGTYLKVGTGTVGVAGTSYNGYILGKDLSNITLFGVLKDVAKYQLIYNAQTNKANTDWNTVSTSTVLEGDTISSFFDVTEAYNFNSSYPFYFSDDWYLDSACTTKMTSSTVITSAMATDGKINLYSKRSSKVELTVTYINYPNATLTASSFYVTSGGTATITLPDAPTRSGYAFKGWSIGTSIADNTLPLPTLSHASTTVAISSNVTIYGVWYQTFTATVNASNANVTGVENTSYEYGQELPISISFTGDSDSTYTITGCSKTLDGDPENIQGTAAISNMVVYVKGNVTVNASSTSSSCLAAGSMIMMADGSEKKVEEITPDDFLLVFNHETGKFESAKVMFVDSDGWRTWRVINLRFSDGTVTRIIYEHGFFDLTLNTYVYIDEFNAQDYIGHYFATTKVVDGNYLTGQTQLVDWFVTEEYTGCYSPTTVYHLNLIVDGKLSMPGGIKGMFNFFDYDPETLAYDKQAMEEDIATYGLMTYDDFKDYMSYEVYCLFPAQYISVSLGKGLMTMEDLEYLIERYVVGLDLESTVSTGDPPS